MMMGKCPGCYERVTLTSTGHICWHPKDPWRASECPGTGMRPMGSTPIPNALGFDMIKLQQALDEMIGKTVAGLQHSWSLADPDQMKKTQANDSKKSRKCPKGCKCKRHKPEPPPPPPPPPPTELCEGGDDPAEGCIKCGNRLYMKVTGRNPDNWRAPDSYEQWRAEYQEYGLPWARERMESYVTLSTRTMLDSDWKPSLSRGEVYGEFRKVRVFSGAVIAAITLFAALAAVFFLYIHSFGALMMFPMIILFAITVGNISASRRLNRDRERRAMEERAHLRGLMRD